MSSLSFQFSRTGHAATCPALRLTCLINNKTNDRRWRGLDRRNQAATAERQSSCSASESWSESVEKLSTNHDIVHELTALTHTLLSPPRQGPPIDHSVQKSPNIIIYSSSVMHALSASPQQRAQPSPPSDVQTQAQQREQYLEQQHILARMARRGVNPPDSWTDPHAVALTLAALQQLIETKRQEVEAMKRQQLDVAPATPVSSSSSSRTLVTTTPTIRNMRQGVAELTMSFKAYEREIEKLQAKILEAAREAEALEALAPPLLSQDGTVVDPLQVLEKVRRKAQRVLAERERIMTREEEEEVAALRRGQGVSGPLSQKPREEAKRLVARKWMGAAGGGERRASGYHQYTEELID